MIPTFHKTLIFTFILLFTPNLLIAEKIYHWTDEDGRTHYSSTPPMKPIEETQLHIIKMKTSVIVKKEEKKKSGQQLWDNTCATCHNISGTRQNGRRGLQSIVIDMNNPATGFESTVNIIQGAVANDMNDMADMEKFNLSADDIRKISEYIIEELNKPEEPKKKGSFTPQF